MSRITPALRNKRQVYYRAVRRDPDAKSFPRRFGAETYIIHDVISKEKKSALYI